MTLLYDAENDFCDRHPSLCSAQVSAAVYSGFWKEDEVKAETEDCFRYEDLTEGDKPEACQI